MADELVPLVREKAAGRKIVLWGHSLGGLVCSELAARLPETSGVIIETSARNAREVAEAWTPWYAAPFVRIEIAKGFGDIDVAKALNGFRGPVLVLGGEKDGTLPVQLARSVGKALTGAGVAAQYVEFKGGGHSDLMVQKSFTAVIEAFFANIG
jgi:pimeloyl-ACP methyl ester carboxylesterase